MSVSDEFLDYIVDQLSGWGEVSVRRMFGGAGIYCRGVMFALVADDVLYLKVDATNREDFERSGMEPFRPYDDKPASMSYYEVPADVLEDRDRLVEWATQALKVATAKKRTPGKAAGSQSRKNRRKA